MARVRILVAITDGAPVSDGITLARGSVEPCVGVPVMRNFDPRLPPFGKADIVVEGDRVYAEFYADPALLDGLTPALGFRLTLGQPVTVLAVSLCDKPNVDARVPAYRKADA